MRRTNAWSFDHDSNAKTHPNPSCFNHGYTIDALFDRLRYICFDKLCWICYMGKHRKYIDSYRFYMILFNYFLVLVEYRSFRSVPAMASLETTEPWATHPSESYLSSDLYFGYHFRDCCANDCQSGGNWIRLSHDIIVYSGIFTFHIVEEQTQMVPDGHG